MENTQASKDQKKYLFNIDILIESDTNGHALEKLLHILNSTEIDDYLVKEGIHLGKKIQTILRETISKQHAKADIPITSSKTSTSKDPHQPIWEKFQGFKENNSLVRLTIIKAMGIKLNIPCRIVNVDPESGNVSVYHVDERQVYLFKINEIDDFSVS